MPFPNLQDLTPSVVKVSFVRISCMLHGGSEHSKVCLNGRAHLHALPTISAAGLINDRADAFLQKVHELDDLVWADVCARSAPDAQAPIGDVAYVTEWARRKRQC